MLEIQGFRFFISCAHRYARSDWSEKQNQQVFQDFYSERAMGHNYQISLSSTVDMKKLRSSAELIQSHLDHKFLNNDVPIFRESVPTTENMAQWIYQLINDERDEPISVRVNEGEDHWVEVNERGRAKLTRRYVIHCLHRHHNPDLSMEENRELYGKCSAIHGHEYQVEVSLEGEIDKETGWVISPWLADELVHKNLVQVFDKKFLNESIGNTSGEIILQVFYKTLRPFVPPGLNLQMTVRETLKNSFLTEASGF